MPLLVGAVGELLLFGVGVALQRMQICWVPSTLVLGPPPPGQFRAGSVPAPGCHRICMAGSCGGCSPIHSAPSVAPGL